MDFLQMHAAATAAANEAWDQAHTATYGGGVEVHWRDDEASEFGLVKWNQYGYTKHVCRCGFTSRTAQGLGLHRAAVRKRAIKAADAAWSKAYDETMAALKAEPKPEPTQADLKRIYGG